MTIRTSSSMFEGVTCIHQILFHVSTRQSSAALRDSMARVCVSISLRWLSCNYFSRHKDLVISKLARSPSCRVLRSLRFRQEDQIKCPPCRLLTFSKLEICNWSHAVSLPARLQVLRLTNVKQFDHLILPPTLITLDLEFEENAHIALPSQFRWPSTLRHLSLIGRPALRMIYFSLPPELLSLTLLRDHEADLDFCSSHRPLPPNLLDDLHSLTQLKISADFLLFGLTSSKTKFPSLRRLSLRLFERHDSCYFDHLYGFLGECPQLRKLRIQPSRQGRAHFHLAGDRLPSELEELDLLQFDTRSGIHSSISLAFLPSRLKIFRHTAPGNASGQLLLHDSIWTNSPTSLTAFPSSLRQLSLRNVVLHSQNLPLWNSLSLPAELIDPRFKVHVNAFRRSEQDSWFLTLFEITEISRSISFPWWNKFVSQPSFSQLTRLKVNCSFNQKVSVLPHSLVDLDLSKSLEFNRRLTRHQLPPHLQRLHLGNGFNALLKNLPDSLQSLSLGQSPRHPGIFNSPLDLAQSSNLQCLRIFSRTYLQCPADLAGAVTIPSLRQLEIFLPTYCVSHLKDDLYGFLNKSCPRLESLSLICGSRFPILTLSLFEMRFFYCNTLTTIPSIRVLPMTLRKLFIPSELAILAQVEAKLEKRQSRLHLQVVIEKGGDQQ